MRVDMSTHSKSQLTCFGEALIDLLPHDGEALLPIVGGAPANVAVGFAKLGGKSVFLGGLSQDPFGHKIENTLQHYGVDTQFCVKVNDANTALAVVQLDQYKERQFSFYRENTADIKVEIDAFDSVSWPENGIFHFCSNTLTDPDISQVHMALLKRAKMHNQLISYDVNLRLNLWLDLTLLPERVERCYLHCDIIKFSQEELDYLCQLGNISCKRYCDWLLSLGVKVIIVSNGKEPVHVITEKSELFVNTPEITVADTTGAGDSLISGFLFYLSNNEIDICTLTENTHELKQAIEFAIKCGAYTCTEIGAMPALPTLDKIV